MSSVLVLLLKFIVNVLASKRDKWLSSRSFLVLHLSSSRAAALFLSGRTVHTVVEIVFVAVCIKELFGCIMDMEEHLDSSDEKTIGNDFSSADSNAKG